MVGDRLRSGLWRSADGGGSWRLVTRDIDFDGHGPATLFGEVISFCPENPSQRNYCMTSYGLAQYNADRHKRQ